MSLQLPPLPSLRVFEAAARHLSFTEAGRELFITQSAISRQIRGLETYLGCKLFIRHTRRIELTEKGQQYLEAIQQALQQMAKATRRIKGDGTRSTLTVSVLPTLANEWLMPLMPRFTQTYPDIELRLITSLQPIDFQSGQVDAALRVGRLPGKGYKRSQPRIEMEMVESWTGVRAVELFADVLVPVLARRLLGQGAPLRTPKDLRQYRLINTSTRQHAWPDWLRAHKLSYDSFQDSLDFGHFFIAMQAARDCRGVALVPLVLLQMCDYRDELVVPFPPGIASAGEYYLLTREADADSRPLRLFSKWIEAEAGQISELARTLAPAVAD